MKDEESGEEREEEEMEMAKESVNVKRERERDRKNTCAWKHYLASRSASSPLAWTTPAYETNRQQNGVPAWANRS